MALLVQKYGGTSVASIPHLENVARRILASREAGHQVVVVVSAMGHETDRLDDLAQQIGVNPATHREVDVLLSTGEQVTTALLAMVLMKHGCPARSYTGGQIRILTDSAYTKARILEIECDNLRADLTLGTVAVVAGFQGVDADRNITTLGRGGSDTTAVALAAALGADECQIYTDVNGVYTTDPRVVDSARCLERLTFEEMLELASLGSRVLHTRAVEFASKYRVPIRVLSSFNDSPGTLITNEDDSGMEQPIISGIAFTQDEAKLTVLGVKDIPGIASRILGPISDANIEVDMIVQNVAADNSTDFTFTVRRTDYQQALAVLQDVAAQIGARQVSGDNRIAKLSLVGVGMRSHAGVASKMFKTMADESINIQMISTSEIKISVVIDEKYLELAVRALHAAFDLAAASA
ncbi:MAG: aspartate kinase [Pseudomonadales bacterium]|jgi:aspartate kinase|nr:aspartate kinase [Pseudomonadales bacterium]MDP4640591.1 aspartate kinase [Pseudomonadales bacterium]MDP4764761.1 aspartate kinase [Pseudomonadales bacterium]MDP4875492.1 aspartate kinase [Pseudomonadales bacterium]MDP4912614.1 aspartate kinase [Pseudomonadales bacterium]